MQPRCYKLWFDTVGSEGTGVFVKVTVGALKTWRSLRGHGQPQGRGPVKLCCAVGPGIVLGAAALWDSI